MMHTDALALDITRGHFLPAIERGPEATSDIDSVSTIVFPDADLAADYLVVAKGLSPERAALVIARRCEFAVEASPDGFSFTTYRFRAA